jgi:hypothetical protein
MYDIYQTLRIYVYMYVRICIMMTNRYIHTSVVIDVRACLAAKVVFFVFRAELHNGGLRNRRCPILVMSGDSIATVPG